MAKSCSISMGFVQHEGIAWLTRQPHGIEGWFDMDALAENKLDGRLRPV
ncbi:hypothetical protein N8703_00750 [Verrucomicrobia bacterium]|nr:hypothetical protein [Verrucomicrobiota bacterium]